MDEFGVLTEQYGLKPQGKSAPMASTRRSTVNSTSTHSNSAYNSSSVNGTFFENKKDSILNGSQKNSNSADVFGDFNYDLKSSNGSSFNFDSVFVNDAIFGPFTANGIRKNEGSDDLLEDFGYKPKGTTQNEPVGFDDLIPGLGSSTSSGRDNNGMSKSFFNSSDDPFGVFESTSSTRTNTSFIDPLGQSESSKSTASSTFSSPLSPPPRPGVVLKADKVKSPSVTSIDELEAFAMGKSTDNANARSNVHNAKEVRSTQGTKSTRYREAEDGSRQSQQRSPDDLESFFSMGHRSVSAPRARVANIDPLFDANLGDKKRPEVIQRKSSGASSGVKKASSATNMVNDLSSIFGDALFSGEIFEEVEGESDERRKARLKRHQRTIERMARAVTDMNLRDQQIQNEQEERCRIADQMDVGIKRWAAGKEGNLRALLSSLQYVLWPECGWEPVSLTDLITSTSVKRVYWKSNLYVHPDKVQQKGATLEQKYTAEKVFDILKEAWNKFNKEELS